VVVAIIALLAGILLPALGAARWQSRHLLCQTNLSSIAQAWHGYLLDSGGSFPKSLKAKDNKEINFGGKQGSSSAYQGSKVLNRYVGLALIVDRGAEVFRCPLDRGSGSIRPTAFDYFGSSYLMNHMLVGQPKLTIAPTDPCRPVLQEVSKKIGSLKVSQVGGESRLMLVGDYGWYNAWRASYTPEYHIEWHRQRMRHNLAFMDGHVDFIRLRKGLHTTAQYTVIPFREERARTVECQVEVPCD